MIDDIKTYLNKRSIEFKETSTGELQTLCLFSSCDKENDKPGLGHLFFNKDGQYYCQKCSAKGNLTTLKKHFGDRQNRRKQSLTQKVEYFVKCLNNNTRAQQFLTDRDLNAKSIKDFQLGYSNRRNSITIPHYFQQTIANIKYRSLDKLNKQKYQRETGGQSVLFNLDNVNRELNYLLIVEGEFDCIIGQQFGVKNIIGSTCGANTFKDSWLKYFDGFQKIFICYDHDKKGQEGAKKLAKIIGIDRCLNVLLPEGEDLNDFFLKGRTAENLKNYFSQAKPFPGAKVITPANALLKMQVQPEPFIVEKMIVEGGINALTSDNGKGKSLLMLKMVTAIARGEIFLEQYKTKKINVLILDLEMSKNDIIQRTHSVVQKPIKGLDFYHCQNFDIENKNDFNWLVKQIQEKKYGLIVVDTLNTAHTREENSNSEMRFVNKKMIELIHDFGVTILYLHHHRKLQKGEHFSQATSRGAGEILAKASSHLLLDSRNITIFENSKGDYKGLHLTIEQFKARQIEKLEKFGVDVWYNPEQGKTIFKYTGEEETILTAKDAAKNFLLTVIKSGKQWTLADLKTEKERQKLRIGESNLREALKELTEAMILNVIIGKQNKKYYFLEN